MKLILTILITAILPSTFWGQDYIVDPDFEDLGISYYRRVLGIEFEPETNTYMVAGTFAGGTPYIPCLNRINEYGQDSWTWMADEFENCDGVNFNFFKTPLGYRFNGNMVQVLSDGTLNQPNIPDFFGTEQLAFSPRGWGDDNGVVYAGSNWLLTEEPGQPETCLLAFTPQGERYAAFPILRCGHPNFVADVTDIYEYDNERLLLGGSFDSLNGHLSIRAARIFKNGVVDTSFSSELEPHFQARIIHVDPQGRVLVYHLTGGSEETPNDDLEIWRLLPDGSVDPTWNIIDLALSETVTLGGSARTTVYNEENGSYYIYGLFNLVNGVPRTSICHIDSSGNLLDTFDDGPFRVDLEAHPQLVSFGEFPELFDIEKTLDGGLLIGGRFTHYQDQPYLNLIKLIPDSTVGISDRDFRVQMKVYPNPAKDQVQVELFNPNGIAVESIHITDLMGRTVANYPWEDGPIDLVSLASGIYLLQVLGADEVLGIERLVIH
ncbi:MAG: T9SS type A sorting domain-containing protein [Cryomorphaceae bacterium]